MDKCSVMLLPEQPEKPTSSSDMASSSTGNGTPQPDSQSLSSMTWSSHCPRVSSLWLFACISQQQLLDPESYSAAHPVASSSTLGSRHSRDSKQLSNIREDDMDRFQSVLIHMQTTDFTGMKLMDFYAEADKSVRNSCCTLLTIARPARNERLLPQIPGSVPKVISGV